MPEPGFFSNLVLRFNRRRLSLLLAMTRAIIKKEWLLQIRYPGLLFAITIWPVLFPLSYILSGQALAGPHGEGLAAFVRWSGTTDYRSYIVLGTTLWMWVNLTLWGLGTWLRQEQLRGTLEANWLAPAPRPWFLFSTLLYSALTDTIFIAISLTEFHLFFGFRLAGSPLLFGLAILATMPSIYGLGLLFAALVFWAKETNSFVFVVRGIFMVFAGVTYPIEIMPGWMQKVAEIIPLTYSLRALRLAALTPTGWPALASDITVTLVAGLVLLFLGGLAFSQTDRLARRLGTVGTY